MSAPSLFSIARTDQISQFAVIAGPICLIMGGLCAVGWLPNFDSEESSWFIDPEDASIFFSMAAVGLAVGVAVLGWRWMRIRRAFGAGNRVPGRITKLTPFRGRAYLHYTYAVGEETVQTLHFVAQTREFRKLRVGQGVTVAVDPGRPKAGFVADIFPGE